MVPFQTKSFAPLIAVSGPSGSGKTTICRRIAEHYGWYYSISHTTRPRREGETHGKDYYFVTKDEFEELKKQDEFLEWAVVFGNLYGTSKKIINAKREAGIGVILDVDTQGAENIKAIIPQAVTVFLKTHDIDILKSRLLKRGRDSFDEIDMRLSQATYELDHVTEYDYVILNDQLDSAIEQIITIIDRLKNNDDNN